MKSASDKVKKIREMKRKMTIAYEHYRFVKQDKIDAFNKKLEAESKKDYSNYYTVKTLLFTPLENYSEVPPEAVLDKIEEAIERNCFDTFEVAQVKEVTVQKDPIVFGRINDCPDRFFVAQWDDDVSIEDILKENEG